MIISEKGSQQRLILWLTGDDTQTGQWLLAAKSGEIIVQGSLQAGAGDETLTQLISTHPALVLVPASDFVFHRVDIPRNARRKIQQIVPFMLEERLATDIDRLHFAVLRQHGESCDIAVVEKNLMHGWLNRCQQLGVQIENLLPDVLALPLSDEGWSAVEMGDRWLLRQTFAMGLAVESCWLADFLAASPPPVIINSYSAAPSQAAALAEWRLLPAQSAEQLAAAQGRWQGADLRQAEFRSVSRWHHTLILWKPALLALGIYLLLVSVGAALSHYRLWQEAVHWQGESVRIYRQLLPQDKKVVNPRVQMQQHLQRQAPSVAGLGVSSQMDRLQKIIDGSRGINIHTLAYDAARKEIRLDLNASSYQTLEDFLRQAASSYHVRPGEIKRGRQRVESQLVLEIP